MREQVSKAHTTHGRTGTPEYRSWLHMLERCYTPTCKSYPDYGGRGITIFEPWRYSFRDFLAHMGPRPSRKHTLDRIDNDGSYTPGNCRWATAREQANNQRSNHRLTVSGRTMTVAEWERETGFGQGRIQARLNLGWDDERAVLTPLRKWHSRRQVGI